MAITQKRMDQLIVGSKRRHKERMERLRQAFLGKRAERESPLVGAGSSGGEVDTSQQVPISQTPAPSAEEIVAQVNNGTR